MRKKCFSVEVVAQYWTQFCSLWIYDDLWYYTLVQCQAPLYYHDAMLLGFNVKCNTKLYDPIKMAQPNVNVRRSHKPTKVDE